MQLDEVLLEAPERHLTVAFDGACKGNPGPGGYAAILINNKTRAEKVIRGRDPATTNNRMELRAAIEALNFPRPGAFIHMLGASQYVVKGLTEWLPGWKGKNWRTTKGPVRNVDLWQELEAATARHAKVTWEWVRAHNGHPLNERADKMASDEARSASSR